MQPATVWISEASVAIDVRLSRRFSDDGWAVTDSIDAAEVVVWVAGADPERLAEKKASAVGGFLAALDSATRAEHLVVLSSAMVYGAWANNPIPLTEDAPLRPSTEFRFARQLGALEQLADDWRVARPHRSVTILRPVVTMSADGNAALTTALAAGMGRRRGEDDPPAQFVHLDDVVDAVVHAARHRLDGVFNVAPDGWIAGERVRALAGSVRRWKLPARLHETISDLRWRFTKGPIPPGLSAYTRWPWLIANDRLKASGWRPKVTNDEAYVEGTEQRWWTMVTPKRRQELALGGLGALIIAGAVIVVSAIRRARRHRPADD